MEFRCYDRHGKQLAPGELSQLRIWNPTMEHIFATAMEHYGKEEIPTAEPVAKE